MSRSEPGAAESRPPGSRAAEPRRTATSGDASAWILAAAAEFLAPPGTPAHAAIADWLLGIVRHEHVSPGDRLPAERALAAALRVSRMTLRQALGQLQSSGHLVRTVGANGGNFIALPRPSVDITNMIGLSPQLLRSVPMVTSRLLEAVTVSARPEVAAALELPNGAPVHRVVRVREAEGRPVVLERSHFPAVLLPNLVQLDLIGSIYEVLRKEFDAAPATAEEELLPVLPRPDEAALLSISTSAPVLRILRTAWTERGEAIEYSDDIFRTDLLRVLVSGRLS